MARKFNDGDHGAFKTLQVIWSSARFHRITLLVDTGVDISSRLQSSIDHYNASGRGIVLMTKPI
jgi:hypothetical protein